MKPNSCNTKKKAGRPKLPETETLYVPFRLRRGRSEAEDALVDRLKKLPARQRSGFIRRVLTTGDIDPILEREFALESEQVSNALAGLASFWDDDEE